jgi:5-methylcytosine-specific restriction protein A
MGSAVDWISRAFAALCRWCDQPVPKGRQSWCSQKCVNEYRELGDWNHIRQKIIDRDKVCQVCGGQRYHAERKGYTTKARLYAGWRERQMDVWGEWTPIKRGWDVDHILAVEDGGTDHPSNLRLLCTRCHKERTALQRRMKADARRGQLSCIS